MTQENPLFNPIGELFKEIEFLEYKVKRLQQIRKANHYRDIRISFFADGRHYTIFQDDTPFSLRNELILLIDETINQLNQDIQTLKIKL